MSKQLNWPLLFPLLLFAIVFIGAFGWTAYNIWEANNFCAEQGYDVGEPSFGQKTICYKHILEPNGAIRYTERDVFYRGGRG